MKKHALKFNKKQTDAITGLQKYKEWIEEPGGFYLSSEVSDKINSLIKEEQALKITFIEILEENYQAAKRMTDEDKKRPAQEIILETYEDLISIYKSKISVNKKIRNYNQVPDRNIESDFYDHFEKIGSQTKEDLINNISSETCYWAKEIDGKVFYSNDEIWDTEMQDATHTLEILK